MLILETISERVIVLQPNVFKFASLLTEKARWEISYQILETDLDSGQLQNGTFYILEYYNPADGFCYMVSSSFLAGQEIYNIEQTQKEIYIKDWVRPHYDRTIKAKFLIQGLGAP